MFAVRHACLNAGLSLGALGAAAVVSVTHPATFTAVYYADAASFLAFLPVLARLRAGAAPRSSQPRPARRPQAGFREVLRDKAFRRVWALTALLVTVSFGQSESSFTGYATRPGGIDTRGLGLAFAANTLTVVGAQLFVLRRLAGHRRTTGAALAAAAWAASWAIVIVAGHLGGGAAADIAFAAALAALRLHRHLPPAANQIPAATTPGAVPAGHQAPPGHQPAGTARQPGVPAREPGRDPAPVTA